ncbi:MAG TPA: hypothetical protein DCZ69_06455 [Syntrophobacteraceae bacterium]|nr:hypothetical protein [Syntrophobacteraceae bacterium]
MICPKCGYESDPEAEGPTSPGECPRCGVIYAKLIRSRSASQPDGVDSSLGGRRTSGFSQFSKALVLIGLAVVCGYLWRNHFAVSRYESPEKQPETSEFLSVPWIHGAVANRVLIIGPT